MSKTPSSDSANNAVLSPDSSKLENVLERLNQRTKDRKHYTEIKNEQRSKFGLVKEGTDYFSDTFNERHQDINLRIQNAFVTESKESDCNESTTSDIRQAFADITMEIQELERYLTKSTMFLSDYKIKSCQNRLQELLAAKEEARLKLIPKKKFGFREKKAKAASTAITDTLELKLGESISNTNAGKVKDFTENQEELGACSIENKSSILINSYMDEGATLSQRKDEYIILSGPDYEGKDITLTNLDNCFIEIKAHLGSLQLQNITKCILLSGPVARSCFVQNCDNSSLAVACQQLRLHSSTSVRLFLHVTCKAVIEESRQVEVAPYNYDYASIASDFKASGLDKNRNHYDDIADFDWLSPDAPSPNWNISKDSETKNLSWQEKLSEFKEKTSTK